MHPNALVCELLIDYPFRLACCIRPNSCFYAVCFSEDYIVLVLRQAVRQLLASTTLMR